MAGLARASLVAKPARERAREWADFAKGAELSWKHKALTVTISDIVTGDDHIAFVVEARKGGRSVYSERHVIVNPPIYHPDGGVDADGNPTFAVNIRAILRGIVEEHIR